MLPIPAGDSQCVPKNAFAALYSAFSIDLSGGFVSDFVFSPSKPFNMTGSPPGPLPMMTNFVFGDSDNLTVA